MTILLQGSPDLAALQPIIFYLLATLIAVSAWAIVLSDNIIRMAVYLMAALAGSAGLYFMMEAEFLAAIQLIVYVGGIMILIIFGVMLTSKSPFAQLKVHMWEKILGVTLALIMSGLLIFAQIRSPVVRDTGSLVASSGYDQVRVIGSALLSSYLIPFEIAGVMLLVVMIGAAYMARRRAR